MWKYLNSDVNIVVPQMRDWIEGIRLWPWVISLVAVLCLAFFPVSFTRFVDGDEGFYLLAAKLVNQGLWPYHDFFYQQTPLLPYVYGVWFWLTNASWISARLLTACLAVCLGLLLEYHVWILTKKRLLSLLAVLLYIFSGVALGWFVVVKTFALSSLLLFAAYVFFTTPPKPLLRWRYTLAGILVGLAIMTRLTQAGALPIFLLYLLITPQPRRAGIHFISGVLTGLSLVIPFLIIDANTFWFNIVGYHAVARIGADIGAGLIGDPLQKLSVARAWLTYFHGRDVDGQLPLLIYVTGAATIWALIGKQKISMAIPLGFALLIINLLPTPTLEQYAGFAIPFLIIGGVLLVHNIKPHHFQEKPKLLLVSGVVFCLLYSTSFIESIKRYNSTGVFVPGIDRSQGTDWRITTVQSISAQINQLTRPGEHVVSNWPGYIFETHAQVVPGFENHFGVLDSNHVSDDTPKDYHVLTDTMLDEYIEARDPKLIVNIENYGGVPYSLPISQEYQEVFKNTHTTIHQRLK